METWSNGFDCLPDELLMKIFAYLSPGDLLEAALVCRRWFNMSQYYTQNLALNFYECDLHPSIEPVSTFLNASRRFHSLRLGPGATLKGDCTDLWRRMGAYITELSLSCTNLSSKMFVDVVTHFRCLKTLVVSNENNRCRLCRNSTVRKAILENFSTLLEDVEVRQTLERALKGVRKVVLPLKILETRHFELLVDMMPELDSLHLAGIWENEEFQDETDYVVMQGNHMVDFDRRDPSEINRLGCIDWRALISLLRERAGQIKEFSIRCAFGPLHIGVIHLPLEQLTPIEKLKLKKLVLLMPLSKISLEQFLLSQTELEYLEILDWNNLNIEDILRSLPKLREVQLKGNGGTGVSGIRVIQNLRQIEHLTVERGAKFESDPPAGETLPVNPMMQKLEFSEIEHDISHLSFAMMIKAFPNLTTLKLAEAKINDEDLMVIFSQMPRLQTLALSLLEKVSDFGFLGLKNGEINSECSIKNLKGLRHLSIVSLDNVSSAIMSHFDFPELRTLTWKQEEISEQSAEGIAFKCPSLEFLELYTHFGLTDAGVAALSKLGRLKCLSFRFGNGNLTRNCFAHVEENCKRLVILQIYDCCIHYPEMQRLFLAIPTLKEINCENHHMRDIRYVRGRFL